MTAHALCRAVKTLGASDRGTTTQEAMRFIMEQSRAARWLDRGLHLSASTPLPVAFALLNGLRCFARMRVTGAPGGVLACAHRPNERRAVARVRAAAGALPWSDVVLDLGDVRAALGDLDGGAMNALARAARLAETMRGRHHHFEVVRAIELVFHYQRFGAILDRGRHRAAVISTYSNPWGVALHAAARRRGLPVALVMHGMPQWPVPRLDYDLAVVPNEMAAATLRRAGCGLGDVIIESSTPEPAPMPPAFRNPRLVVGMLLSKDPVVAEVMRWLRALLDRDDVASIVVRPHPASLWSGMGAAIGGLDRARVSVGTAPAPLDDLRRCDLAIAGNSSIHVDAAAAGIPSVHARGLDHVADGALPFVDDGLVLSIGGPRDLAPAHVLRFYQRPEWLPILRRYARQPDRAGAGADDAAAIRARMTALVEGT